MRLATFEHDGARSPGVVADDEVVAIGGPDVSLSDVLAAGDVAARVDAALADRGARRLPLAEVRLCAPVAPRKFFAIGLNYADHVAETGREAPKHLTVFTKAPTSVTGPFDPVELPAVSHRLDYEGELGIVIGARCRHVRADDAPSVIAGYVVVDDVSVRDWQRATTQWSLAKSFDTHGPIGPWIVTADELGDPHALDLRTTVNGEVRQQSNTSNLIFDCYDAVEILSQACTLEPGDVIATGTPSGIAGAMEGTPWLVAGDRVKVEISGIGAIENEIVREQVADDFVVDPSWVGGRAG